MCDFCRIIIFVPLSFFEKTFTVNPKLLKQYCSKLKGLSHLFLNFNLIWKVAYSLQRINVIGISAKYTLYVFSTRTFIYKYHENGYTTLSSTSIQNVFVWYVFSIFQTSLLYNTLLYATQLNVIPDTSLKFKWSNEISNPASPSDTGALHL